VVYFRLEAPPRRYSRSLLMKCANGITRRLRLPPDDIQALSGCYMTPSSIHILVQPELARSCSNHDPVLEVSSAGKCGGPLLNGSSTLIRIQEV
nr:hypothetical protein [Tanacetum cinerariifolium]